MSVVGSDVGMGLLTVMQLSYASLTTSYSISFQPFRLLSISTWVKDDLV